jgi:hypothetical protein
MTITRAGDGGAPGSRVDAAHEAEAAAAAHEAAGAHPAARAGDHAASGALERLATTNLAAGTLAQTLHDQLAKKVADGRVNAATKAVVTLESRVHAAGADGKITKAEHDSIAAQAAKAKKAAEGLVAAQGKPAVAAIAHVEKFLKTGELALHADAEVTRLVAGQKAMFAEAKREAKTDPFKHLGKGWRAPFQGVREKDFKFDGLSTHVIAIDLANPTVRLQTNQAKVVGHTGAHHDPVFKGDTPQHLAQAAHAEIAVNADFFSWATHRPSGFAESFGHPWPGTQKGSEPSLSFYGGHAEMRAHGGPPDWAQNVVSARPSVLQDGKVVTHFNEPGKALPAPRTGMALSKDGRVLYIVAAAGNESRGVGLTGSELGRLMKKLGADDGIAMDSGGSAQLYESDRGMLQRSTDPGGARAVANVLMVQAQKPKKHR